MNRKQHVLVVGGGITGLTVAYYIQKQMKEEELPLTITLAEKSERLGGKIQTERHDGFVIEKGPDSFLARKPAIIDLSLELGLEEKMVGTNPAAKKNFILHRNQLHLMPPGLILGIPTQMAPFVKTGLISPLGKVRAAMDLVIPARKEESDESLGGFLQRRLGREVAENIAEPLLSGIYAGDTQALSLSATFPQFQAIERKYGSIIKGMLFSRKAGGAAPLPKLNLPPAVKNSMFLSYQGGLETLVDSLQEAMTDVNILTNHGVKSITSQGRHYQVEMENGKLMEVDSVVLAAPAYAAMHMLRDLEEISALAETRYVSVANVVMAFERKDIQHPLDASGFVVPHKEGKNITASTWTSSKWPLTTPDNKVLIRSYVGHSRNQTFKQYTDEELVDRVSKDLRDIMGLDAKPIFSRVTRWHESMPQYRVGHLERLQKVRKELKMKRPGIFLAGAGYEGVGIPDCIQQGKNAARWAVQYLSAQKENVTV
ncbi:protoporphyrinogen oxidase [Ammoniphilus sp. YIM 78166]|uniref:protoporphyrinogen oxidase n=1 Tax=Ammoniphilus sp. YIM 78166 TaxID=1644106 RepID=UPI00106F5907|nr:protoporphyrinogen oxidase [Ammoniphilus sp. YIM 78166]